MNLARSALKIFLSKIGSTAVSFLAIVFFARHLGPNEMGVFFLFQAVLGVLSIPTDFGIANAVSKRLSEGADPGAHLSTAICIKLGLVAIFCLGILTFNEVLNSYLDQDVAVYLVLGLILQSFGELAVQTLEGELRAGETSLPTLAKQLAFAAIGSGLVLLNFGANGLIYALLAGLTVKVAWAAAKISITLAPPSRSHAAHLLKYSKYAFITGVGAYAYSWVDVAIIGLYLEKSQVGIYEIVWRVTTATVLFSQAIATSVFPQVSEWSAGNRFKEIEDLLPEAIAASLLLVIPSFFGILALSKEILAIVFGTEYVVGWLVLIILMAEKVLQGAHIVIGRALHGINQPNLAARAAIISIVMNVGLNLVLVPIFGIEGAAVATTISFVVNAALHAYYLNTFINLHIPFQEVASITLAALAMFCVVLGLKALINITTILHLVGIIGLGAAAYSLFSVSIPTVRRLLRRHLLRFRE